MSTAADITIRSLVLEDLQDVASLSTASISADGGYIAYVSTKTVWKENIHTDCIIVARLSPWTEIKIWQCSVPQWSTVTYEVAYLSEHKGETYIWLYSLADDSQRPLAPVYESHYFMGHLSMKLLAWSPDGLK